MKKSCLSVLMLVLLLIIGSVLFAKNLQKVYPVDSDIYQGIRILYAEAGIAPPSSSGPWSAAELDDMMQRLKVDELSKQGRSLYRSLQESLDVRDMGENTAQGSIGFNPTFEMYLHQNDTDYRLDTDWLYNYDYRRPLVNIPIELFMTDYIYNQTNLAILKTRISYNNVTTATDSSEIFSPNLATNFPFDEALVNHVDLNFPERAVIGMGFNRMNLTIGRDDIRWSSGRTGSLTVGDHLDYYDFARFSTFHKNFKYTYLVAGFDSPTWVGGQNSTIDTNDTPTTDNDNLKMYIAHRFEFRFLKDRATFVLTEAMVYQTSSVDFRYLNPAMFFHNMFIRANSNSTLAFELDVRPIDHIGIYANLLVDEFPYPGEDQTSSGAHPTALGQQYGIEASYPIGPGYLTGWLEYVKTDPMLYLRDQVDYIVNRRIFNMETETEIVKNFLGYQYGGDLIMIAGGVDYQWFDFLDAAFKVMYMRHGENNMNSTWDRGPDYVNQTTPYDNPATADKTVENSLVVSARVRVTPFSKSNVKHLRPLEFLTQLDYLNHQNKGNVTGNHTNDLQCTLGVSWSL